MGTDSKYYLGLVSHRDKKTALGTCFVSSYRLYLVGKLAICMSHIVPRSDEDTRSHKIFLPGKTSSNMVRCSLYNGLVSGFSVKYFTGGFHFNWSVEHSYGWYIGWKWRFPVP